MRTVEFTFDIGDPVTVIPIEAEGFVVSLWLSDKGIRYEVRWWIEGKSYTEYLMEREIKPRHA